LNNLSGGWANATATWSYASPTSFLEPGNVVSKYPIGTKIKLTNSTTKYFYVAGATYSSPNTTVTLAAGSDFVLVNNPITANFFSYQSNPQSFPHWFDYVPAWTATTAPALGNGSITGRFTINGRKATVTCGLTLGSSSTTGTGQWFISLPVTPGTGYSDFEGTWRANDAGVMNYGGTTLLVSGDRASFIVNGSTYITSTGPFTWADGDNLHFTISFPV
jgi:hypothetical protein